MINHEPIKGTNFADLIFYYVEAINNYAIPSILSTFVNFFVFLSEFFLFLRKELLKKNTQKCLKKQFLP